MYLGESPSVFLTLVLLVIMKPLKNTVLVIPEYGKYVLPLVLPSITKYAVVKALAPNNTVAIDSNTGEISYDYKSLKEVHLQTLDITNPASAEDEAKMVLEALSKGLKKLIHL